MPSQTVVVPNSTILSGHLAAKVFAPAPPARVGTPPRLAELCASRRHSAPRPRVALHGGDPVTAAGVRAALIGFDLVEAGSSADVQVVCAPAVTPDLMRTMRAAGRGRRVLVADDVTALDVLTAVECGVVAVLRRSEATPRRLRDAVLDAARGVPALHPAFLGALLDELRRVRLEVLRPRGLELSGLAPHEVDVLRLVAEGCDTEEIAARLDCSPRAVKQVVQGLTKRLGLRNRPHAVAYAFQAGVI
ncbi:LuxR family transcriptional regulator [Actinosynnema sp. NPDC053489]|uniref:LuxR family transcriptional regulator n=1 Tax=Actinosynnema sp. NPDC053489 TaxID=3363916 RepID=UPI0037C84D29